MKYIIGSMANWRYARNSCYNLIIQGLSNPLPDSIRVMSFAINVSEKNIDKKCFVNKILGYIKSQLKMFGIALLMVNRNKVRPTWMQQTEYLVRDSCVVISSSV